MSYKIETYYTDNTTVTLVIYPDMESFREEYSEQLKKVLIEKCPDENERDAFYEKYKMTMDSVAMRRTEKDWIKNHHAKIMEAIEGRRLACDNGRISMDMKLDEFDFFNFEFTVFPLVTLKDYKSLNIDDYKDEPDPLLAFSTALVNCAEVYLSTDMVNERVEEQWQQYKQTIEAQNITIEQFLSFQNLNEEQFKNQMIVPSIEQQFKLELILHEIAKDLKIEVTDDDYNEYLNSLVERTGYTLEQIQKAVPDITVVHDDLLINKTMQTLINHKYEK